MAIVHGCRMARTALRQPQLATCEVLFSAATTAASRIERPPIRSLANRPGMRRRSSWSMACGIAVGRLLPFAPKTIGARPDAALLRLVQTIWLATVSMARRATLVLGGATGAPWTVCPASLPCNGWRFKSTMQVMHTALSHNDSLEATMAPKNARKGHLPV